jgi:ATP-dependent Lhr-like helicase
VWGRLFGAGSGPVRTAPIAFVRRADLEIWRGLARKNLGEGISAYGRAIRDALRSRGALFQGELERATGLLPEHFEAGLAEAVTAGVTSCDSFRGLRQLIVPASRRRRRVITEGRWSAFAPIDAAAERDADGTAEFVARQLLNRWGVVFRRILDREKIPVPWRDLARAYRTLEWRGEIRGGRFVGGFTGEQFALPEAVTALRKSRREGRKPDALVSAADPLNLRGILTPDRRVAPNVRAEVPLV